jgi:uncharacterized protein (TIRG00374 family)
VRLAPKLRALRSRRAAAIVATLALAGIAYVFVLPHLANYGAVWRSLQRLGWPWIAALLAVTAANIATFAPPWQLTLPGLGFVKALGMTQASTAFSLVVPGGAPAGMAASFATLRSWGFPRRAVGLAVTLTGVWNQLSVFVFPVLAVALLMVEGGVSHSLLLIAATGVVLVVAVTAAVAVVLSRVELAYRAGELVGRLATRVRRLRGKPASELDGEALVALRSEALALLERRWVPLTLATFANQLTGYLILEFSLRALGVSFAQISIAESFTAWSVGRLLQSLPLTPGGIGVVELGLTGTLIGFGGPHATVVAAVLLYRVLSIVPTLLLGLAAVAAWRQLAGGAAPVARPGHAAIGARASGGRGLRSAQTGTLERMVKRRRQSRIPGPR